MTMERSTYIGTVRSVAGDRCVIVGRDGMPSEVRFVGEVRPFLGTDVIGSFEAGGGERVLRLSKSIADVVLEGNFRLSASGMRPDVTARILQKMLNRSGGFLRPGTGMGIERAPATDDADLRWAIAAFRAEADRLGTALNVVDARAVAKTTLRAHRIADLSLPADVEGNTRAMRDLRDTITSGFVPMVNRLREGHTASRQISVNFVLPYSPFMTSTGFVRSVTHMDRGYGSRLDLTLSESRKLASARSVAMALAHVSMGAGGTSQMDPDSSHRAAHLAASFADAAAVLAFASGGGRRDAVRAYRDMRLASLHFARRPGSRSLRDGCLAAGTHRAIEAAMDENTVARCSDAQAICREAARIARRYALPASRFDGVEQVPTTAEAAAAREASERVAVNLRYAATEEKAAAARAYRGEIEELVAEHSGDPVAEARLQTFGRRDAPLIADRAFDEAVRDLVALEDVTVPFKEPRQGSAHRSPIDFEGLVFADFAPGR